MPVQASAPDAEYKRCRDCGRSIPSWQHRHRARDCPGYSELWAGDTRVKLFAALRAYSPPSAGLIARAVTMVTVTGPGQDAGLFWDPSRCAHLGEHRHSGTLGCRVYDEPASAWNRHAPTWWRSLHNQAAQQADREVGSRPVLLARVWELQRRGILHVHLVLGYSTVQERAAADLYRGSLDRLAPANGFGFVDRKVDVADPTAAAAYLSSYFVAGKKGKLTLTDSVRSGSMPPSIIYVSPVLSQASGVTMRSLRLKRYLWRLGSAWPWLHDHFSLSLEDLVRAHRCGLKFEQIALGAMWAAAP